MNDFVHYVSEHVKLRLIEFVVLLTYSLEASNLLRAPSYECVLKKRIGYR